MKISVVGTINADTIIGPDGAGVTSLGGILYNVIALCCLMPRDLVAPVTYYGSESEAELNQLFRFVPNLTTSGMVRIPGKCNENTLRYVSPDRRSETLTVNVPEIEGKMIDGCLQSDVVLLNFTWGFEVGLETARAFRERFTGTVYVDVHSMALGIAEDGARFEHRVDHWREWAGLADIIQMNAREAELLTGSKDTLVRISEKVCGAGPGICLVTLGPNGVFAAQRKSSGIDTLTMEAQQTDVVDTTGCGDVFSAGFISSFVRGGSIRDACVAGNKAASSCCRARGIAELREVLIH